MASPPSRTLQDVVFAVHFVGAPLTVLDAASWVETFNEIGLDVQQYPALPPAQFTPASQPVPFLFGMMPPAQIPRLFLRRDDVSEYLVFQSDRVGFAWHRVEPVGTEAAYPGFDELRLRWKTLLDRFNAWCEQRLGERRPPRLVELSYQNAIPTDEPDGSLRHVPPYFRLATLGERAVEQFQVAWREVVPNTGGGYVDAVGAIGTVPPARAAFLFN
ncbi:MAG TPA: hypothetical protein VME40_02905, partial [Caulobacteraceae bacterium]|nr:hypothetical protein [Caulobacteraceae bacterium]